MPDLAGRLYPSEKAALRREKLAKTKATEAVVEAPKPVGEPRKPLAGLDRVMEQVVKSRGLTIIDTGSNGRQLKATPKMIEGIIDSIKVGLTIDKAIVAAGVSRRALEKWRKANESLWHLFEQAELQSESELIRTVSLKAPSDWKAGAWLLERRHGWQPVSRAELTGKDGGPILAMSIHKSLLSSVGQGTDPLSKAKRAEPAAAAAAAA